MDKDFYYKAHELRRRIESLQYKLDTLPPKPVTWSCVLNEDLLPLFKETIQNKIDELEKEFEEL